MKIFAITDVEWFIGATLEDCIKEFQENYAGHDPELVAGAREVTEEELDTLLFTDSDENERPTGEKRTFREQLAIEIANGGDFPRLFGTSEW